MGLHIALRAEDTHVRRTCFAVPGRLTLPRVLHQTYLSDAAASALATLIPLLGCGEEAAAIAFDGLSQSSDVQASAALNAIASEERVHDALMRQLASALPEPVNHREMMRAARHFHIDLGNGSADLHLARIAALDSAVCTVISRLTRIDTPLRADPVIANTLIRIRDDEVRHVAVSRRLALARGHVTTLKTAAADARGALAKILMLAAEAFEALGVDPDRLNRDVSHLPDGLLAA
jgi:demethoxyubiquinone hydroxylase (CLK1/Coq7/Cat5 family)